MTNRKSQRALALMLMAENMGEYLPVWWFVGEKYSETLGEWVMLSHKVPARLTELYQDGEVDRVMVKGKTGARYYSYKLKMEN